jgi:hypothetical protein
MFYTIDQNNSGGRFAIDYEAGITCYVIVEADNAIEANERAEQIGIYFEGVEDGYDCECCGDRWYTAHEDDAKETPTVYGEPPEKYVDKPCSRWDNHPVCVHYKDGRKEWFPPLPKKE